MIANTLFLEMLFMHHQGHETTEAGDDHFRSTGVKLWATVWSSPFFHLSTFCIHGNSEFPAEEKYVNLFLQNNEKKNFSLEPRDLFLFFMYTCDAR